MTKNQIGVLGLSTMGKSLALNLADHDFKVAGFNRTFKVTQEINHTNFNGYEHLEDFISSLEKPRKIILMVKSGKPIDDLCETLLGYLDQGDIIIDGGNSYFKDTIRREEYLKGKGILFYGVGVSGGEKGARFGPSIMPGGDRENYHHIERFLNTISAKKNGEDCCAYIGHGGAGHYVKMIHNGIEYADMQLIAESYILLKESGLTNEEMSNIFKSWNETEYRSYLLEITANILLVKDDESEISLVDLISDESSQKGTGKWTSIESLEQNQNASLIVSAVQSRVASSMRLERNTLKGKDSSLKTEKQDIVSDMFEAYRVGKIVAYAQGFMLMQEASKIYGWNLDLKSIASIFRAGCIIQTDFLEGIMNVFDENPTCENLILDATIQNQVLNGMKSLRNIAGFAITTGVPIPVFLSTLTTIDQFTSPLLGANLIQAQRDYFGAHTFKRIGNDENEHFDWEK